MQKAKRILGVKIERCTDPDPDTSWMGEYSDTRTSAYSIDREHSLECPINYLSGLEVSGQDEDDICNCGGNHNERGEYRYFNPSFNYVDKCGEALQGNTPEEVRKNVAQDYARMESLNNGSWGFVGITASAQVQLTPNGPIQNIRSGGLWGIESDSDERYFAEVESDELADLKAQLLTLGISTRAISAAFKNIVR